MNFIVPIHIEALRVSPSTAEQAKTTLYDFSTLGQHPASGLGNLIAAKNFKDANTQLNQEPGVHLHWTLPRAYTHGVQDRNTGQVDFPTVPNRWLVIRYFKDNQKSTDNTRIRMWILESDAHSASSTDVGNSQTTIPWMDQPDDIQGIGPNFIGKKIDLSGNWIEPDSAGGGVSYLGTRFQAPFGYGETFTPYYQNCGNILGLYDKFDDYFTNPNQLEINSDFTASYSAIGWVSPTNSDECNVVLKCAVEDYNQMTGEKPDFAGYIENIIETTLQWSLEDYSSLTAANTGDIQAVMSGVLADVTWKISEPKKPLYPDPAAEDLPDTSSIQVAIGNNTAEAFSAYIDSIESALDTDDDSVTSNVEWLLNALQFNQLHKLAAGDVGVGQLQEYLHGTAFAAEAGGYLWSVRQKQTPGEKPVPGADNEITLPTYLAKVLSELNGRQQSLDAARNEIASRQRQLFFDWTYHITNVDQQVIHGSSSLSSDDSGDFLIDGLLQLYPALLSAGNFVEAGLPATPYEPKADAFSIMAPTSQIPDLPTYAFNSADNAVAAGFVQHLLKLGLGVNEVDAGDLPTAASALAQAVYQLELYQAGGAQVDQYLKQANAAITIALDALGDATSAVAALNNDGSGLNAAKAQVDASRTKLDSYTDPASGVFAKSLPYQAAPDKAPLPKGETYKGTITSRATLAALVSWDTAVEDYPGTKLQMDVFAGQGRNSQHLLDIQQAALNLGCAYFYAKSGISFVCSSAYYLQLAESVITTASSVGAAASSDLADAVGALSGSTLTTFSSSLQQIVSTDIPKIQAELAAYAPDVASALTDLKALLAPSSPGAPTLPGLQEAVLSTDWQTTRSAIDSAVRAVAGLLPTSQQVAQWNQFLYTQVSDRYDLHAAPADHYFGPSEPVILLAEEKTEGNLLAPFLRNGRAPKLPCRLESEIITAGAAVTFPTEISGLASALSTGITGLSDILQKLAEESYLLSPELSSTVSPADLKIAADSNETLHYNKLHDVELNTPPTGLEGKLPYYIAYNWRSDMDPFLPLFIWWEADYQYSQKFDPTSEAFPSDFLDQFELGQNEIELQPSAASMPEFARNANQPNHFTTFGLISLSAASTSNLCGQIQDYCETYLGFDPAAGPPSATVPNPPEAQKFYAAYQDYMTRNILSQGLSGFNPSMVQRAQELQIPINIPPTWTASSGKHIPLSQFWPTSFLHNQSENWPVTWNDEGINSNALSSGASKVYFNPLRAGFMGVTKITLVDAFGRFIDLPNPAPSIIAENMKASQPAPADHDIYLAPRLVQPSRLSFDWMSAASPEGIGGFTELNHHPAASPICGWIWPNHLDDSLMLYDATGISLGSLRSRGSSLHWFPVPGETTQAGADNQAQMVQYLTEKNANPVFTDLLISFLYPNGSSATDTRFETFLTVLEKSKQFIVTSAMQEDQALSVLVGRPMVVTQASLSLEQKGLPFVGLDEQTYPAWNKFDPQFQVDNSDYIPYNFDNFNQGGISDLSVPVRVGTAEIQQPGGTTIPYFDDGLAGYFMPGEWNTLYTPVDMPNTAGITSVSGPTSHPLSLCPNGPEAKLTFLMDPRAAVHATTGILPVQSVAIPSDQYSRILNQLEITFLSAPILAAQDPPSIPLPPEKGYQWSWVEVGSAPESLKPAQGVTDAVFPQKPQELIDGWLRLTKKQ